jgi:cation transport regulator ChaC
LKNTKLTRNHRAMWIFGYGSLMFDGWEAACGCTDRKWADLPGYRRSFNKKSVESRGTREAPGLTLNLVRSAGHVCRGIAFASALMSHVLKTFEPLRAHYSLVSAPRPTEIPMAKANTGSKLIYRGVAREVLDGT